MVHSLESVKTSGVREPGPSPTALARRVRRATGAEGQPVRGAATATGAGDGGYRARVRG